MTGNSEKREAPEEIGLDKFSAVWVSHSSISDFLRCPRLYFLRNLYKSPQTGRKISLMNPALALGQAVHQVIEQLAKLPQGTRFKKSLLERLEKAWEQVSGPRGGFFDETVEQKYKKRGQEMLGKIEQNPGPLANLAVKIKDDLPYFWLSTQEQIILCGKIDWLEYLSQEDGVHIIDFKTGRAEEGENSLQLLIYYLLASHCQKRPVIKASYWYLGQSLGLQSQPLPDLEESRQKVLKTAQQIKLARQLERFKCPQGENGCSACQPYEAILRGEGELVGQDSYRQDVYVLKNSWREDKTSSLIH